MRRAIADYTWDYNFPEWEKFQTTFKNQLLHVSVEGTIEDDCKGLLPCLLQVDFANKCLGSGVLSTVGKRKFHGKFGLWSAQSCIAVNCLQRLPWMVNACFYSAVNDSATTRLCVDVSIAGDYIEQTPLDWENWIKHVRRKFNQFLFHFENFSNMISNHFYSWWLAASTTDLWSITHSANILRDEWFMIYEYLVKNKIKISNWHYFWQLEWFQAKMWFVYLYAN